MECVLFSILLVVIYIITIIVYMYLTYKEYHYVSTIGGLLDRTESWMFIPLVNTVTLLILALCICIYLILKYTGIIKLWNKIRNIKI